MVYQLTSCLHISPNWGLSRPAIGWTRVAACSLQRRIHIIRIILPCQRRMLYSRTLARYHQVQPFPMRLLPSAPVLVKWLKSWCLAILNLCGWIRRYPAHVRLDKFLRKESVTFWGYRILSHFSVRSHRSILAWIIFSWNIRNILYKINYFSTCQMLIITHVVCQASSMMLGEMPCQQAGPRTPWSPHWHLCLLRNALQCSCYVATRPLSGVSVLPCQAFGCGTNLTGKTGMWQTIPVVWVTLTIYMEEVLEELRAHMPCWDMFPWVC